MSGCFIEALAEDVLCRVGKLVRGCGPQRGSLTLNLAQIWWAGGGGAAPPRTPLQKAIRALGCSGWSLFRDRAACPGATALLGAELFPEVSLLMEEATCPG